MTVNVSVGPTREEVFGTLFNLLKKAPGFVNYSRRFVMPQQIPAEMQPVLILREWHETSIYQQALEKRTWTAWVYGFARVPIAATNPDGSGLFTMSGAEIINPLMDAVEDAIEPPPGVPEQQLMDANGNPQVAHVRFSDTLKETGDTDPNGQAFFVFELNILLP